MLIQEPMCLERRKRHFSNLPWSLTIPPSFTLFASSLFFFLSCLSSLTSRRWLEVENTLSPVSAPISSYIACRELVYLSNAIVTRFCTPRLSLFTSNVLRVPTTVGKVLDFLKKDKAIIPPKELFHSHKRLYRIFWSAFQKYPLQLDCTNHLVVTYLRIFNLHFDNRMNISLQFIRPIFHPLAFGFFIPNITAEITCACETLNPWFAPNSFPTLILSGCKIRILFVVSG